MIDKKKYSKKLILTIIIILVAFMVGTDLVRAYIVNTAMGQGENAYDKYDNDLAIMNYNRAIKFSLWDKEKKADSFLWRGRSYYGKQEYELALADFTEAIELIKDYYPYYTWRARTHYKMENYELSIADFSKSIEITEFDGSDNWDIYLERAKSYSMNKEYNLEIADYDLAISALDKKVNSPYISDDRINELKEKRNEIINYKNNTKRFIEYKKKNPESILTYFEWSALDFFRGGK